MFYHLGIHFLRAAERLRQQKKFNIHLKSVRLESGECLVLSKIYINALICESLPIHLLQTPAPTK